MAGSISDALEIKLLDHVLKNDAFAVPANIYIALSTADPLDTGAGIAEPVGDGYARVVCNSWDVAASRATENTDIVTFPEAEGDGWGTITHFAIFDAITGGNFLAHGDLAVSKTVGVGANVSFAAGDIDISFSAGGISTHLANELLDHVFKTGEYSQLTHLYVAASTANPTDDGSGMAEPSDGYARKLHDAYDAAAAGASENTGAITFDQASGAWGTITYVAIFDALSGGNMLLYAELDSSVAIADQDTLQFNDGGLDITMA